MILLIIYSEKLLIGLKKNYNFYDLFFLYKNLYGEIYVRTNGIN